MSELVYDRAFYVLPEKIAQDIITYAKEQEVDMRTGDKVPDGYQFPKPNLAIDSGFLMVLMQGYCSSLHIPMEMKEGLIDLYEVLIKINLHNDEKDSAIVKLKRMIQSSESVRSMMIGYVENSAQEHRDQEEIEPEPEPQPEPEPTEHAGDSSPLMEPGTETILEQQSLEQQSKGPVSG